MQHQKSKSFTLRTSLKAGANPQELIQSCNYPYFSCVFNCGTDKNCVNKCLFDQNDCYQNQIIKNCGS